jgi:hypothetical protein
MGRDGEGEVSSRVTRDQGGQDSTMQKEGFQVSKRGTNRETSKGSKKEELRHNLTLPIYVRVHNNCMNATNKRMCLGYK